MLTLPHPDPTPGPRTTAFGVAAAVTAALLISACGSSGDDTSPTTSERSAGSESTEAATRSPATAAEEPTLVTAPDSDRVDLETPTFSEPTSITNPLFPISELTQVVQLGTDEGEPLRVEATLLPDTKSITWEDQEVEAVVSQFIAYIDGRVVETAHDFFAQADDGSVWYFGEDVTNYSDGAVEDHEGTWLAGEDGPPGMIMPADPQVGDVYRPENIPGSVFEQVTVKEVGTSPEGPLGPVPGSIVVQELQMDGATEDKGYAVGYGEFSAHTTDEDIVVALGVPLDAVDEATPAELVTLTGGAAAIATGAEGDVEAMTAAADAYLTGDVPEVLAGELRDTVDALAAAVEHGDEADVRQAAVAVEMATADLRLRHEPRADVDALRVEAWTHQRTIDTEAGDEGAVAGDDVILATIRDRMA